MSQVLSLGQENEHMQVFKYCVIQLKSLKEAIFFVSTEVTLNRLIVIRHLGKLLCT